MRTMAKRAKPQTKKRRREGVSDAVSSPRNHATNNETVTPTVDERKPQIIAGRVAGLPQREYTAHLETDPHAAKARMLADHLASIADQLGLPRSTFAEHSQSRYEMWRTGMEEHVDHIYRAHMSIDSQAKRLRRFKQCLQGEANAFGRAQRVGKTWDSTVEGCATSLRWECERMGATVPYDEVQAALLAANSGRGALKWRAIHVLAKRLGLACADDESFRVMYSSVKL